MTTIQSADTHVEALRRARAQHRRRDVEVYRIAVWKVARGDQIESHGLIEAANALDLTEVEVAKDIEALQTHIEAASVVEQFEKVKPKLDKEIDHLTGQIAQAKELVQTAGRDHEQLVLERMRLGKKHHGRAAERGEVIRRIEQSNPRLFDM